MKLSILYESRNPKQPTDLSLVATQSTKDGAIRGKYPVNFYSGKIGNKSNGKVVLGYHDKDDKFKTTGPIVGIVQSKKAPDRWLIKTENNGPYYYSIQMPEATVMATYNRYLKGTAATPIPIYAYDQNTKKHINKKDAGKRANEGWSYYNGTTISKNNMPTRKPKTSVEAYNYLMYWAYHNHRSHSAASTSDYHDLIAYLSGGKKLSKGISDIVKAFPNAQYAVTKRLKYIEEEEDKLFELNLDDDSGVARDEEPAPEPAPKPDNDDYLFDSSLPAPAPAPKPEPEPEPTPKPTPELDPHIELEPREPDQSGSDADRLQTAGLMSTWLAQIADQSGSDADRLQTELSDLEQEIARLTTSLEGDPASANTANIIKELDKCLTKLSALQAEADAVQDTSADDSSALDQDTHQGQASDSGSVEMPASNPQQTAPEEASPEVVALNSKKFIKLLTKLLEMDPEEAPKRLRKVISEFLELRHEPASWGKCFVDDQDSDLVWRLEDYDRLCSVKAFWAGDNRKSNERRELEWSKMNQEMKAFVGGLRNTVDSDLVKARASLKIALKQLIDKIRQIDPSVL